MGQPNVPGGPRSAVGVVTFARNALRLDFLGAVGATGRGPTQNPLAIATISIFCTQKAGKSLPRRRRSWRSLSGPLVIAWDWDRDRSGTPHRLMTGPQTSDAAV